MGRISIPVVAVTRDGIAPGSATVASATSKHALTENDGATWIEIVSTDAGAQSVSFQIPGLIDGQAVAPKVVAVPAGATRLAGPFPARIYNQTSPVAADGTLTSTGTAPANNDTVTIDTRTYTFKTTLSSGPTVADEVLIGASAATALANLKAAINDTGVEGTNYSTGTAVHGSVTATTLTSTTLLVVAIAGGTFSNTIPTTEASTQLSWGAATLLGGLETGAVLIDPSVSTTLTFRAAKLSAT